MNRLLVTLLAGLLALAAHSAPVNAQGCGQSNPNCIVPTAPPGTNNNQAASTAFVQNAASAPVPVFVTTATYTVQPSDRLLAVNYAGAVTITLIPASTYLGGTLEIKDISGHASSYNISISGQTIDGLSSYVISNDYGAVALTTISGAWYSSPVNAQGGLLQPGNVSGNPTSVQAPARGALLSAFGVTELNLKGAPFFAKGDGVTDDTAAINAWLLARQSVATPCFGNSPCAASTRNYAPAGTYNFCGLNAISNQYPLLISGDGEQSTLFADTCNSSESGFLVSGTLSSTNVIAFEHIGCIQKTNNTSASRCFDFAGASSTSLGLVYLDHISCGTTYYCMHFVNTFGFSSSNNTVNGATCSGIYAHDESANAAGSRGDNFIQVGRIAHCPAVDIANAQGFTLVGSRPTSSNGNWNTYSFNNTIGLSISTAYTESAMSAGPGDLQFSGTNYAVKMVNNNWGACTVTSPQVSCPTVTWNHINSMSLDGDTFNGVVIAWGSSIANIKIGPNQPVLLNGGSLPNPSLTFASLSACTAANGGDSYFIVDSSTLVIGTTITGGGSNRVVALCNEVNWVVDSTNAPIGQIASAASGNISYYSGTQTISGDPCINISGSTMTVGSAASSCQGILNIQGSVGGNVVLTSPASNGSPTISIGGNAGTMNWTFPSGSQSVGWGSNGGTVVVSASSPLAINSGTGNMTCPGCLNNTPSALTAGNDTNVTLTLGGTPTTALLQAASVTAGWTGTLSTTRGGLGANNGAANGLPVFSSGAATVSTSPALGTPTATSIAIGAGSAITSSGAGGAMGTAAFQSTGTSGATIPLNNGGFTQSGVANFTSTVQVNGNAQTFPAAVATLARTDAGQTFTGSNIFNSAIQSVRTLVSDALVAVSTAATPTALYTTASNLNNGFFFIEIDDAAGPLLTDIVLMSQGLVGKVVPSATISGSPPVSTYTLTSCSGAGCTLNIALSNVGAFPYTVRFSALDRLH